MSVNKNKKSPYRAFWVILIAVLIVGGISLLPLEELTGGRLKGFNLFGDLMEKSEQNSTEVDAGDANETSGLDPELAAAMKEENDTTEAGDEDESEESGETKDEAGAVDGEIIPVKPSRVGGKVLIEDYTSGQNGLHNLRASLGAGGLSRIAVLGDSYIEGDILTQDLRDQLQGLYGGSGVGYMNLFSPFPGFRRSVKQGGKGWTEYAINKKSNKSYMGLSQHYFKPDGLATATYRGSKNLAHTGQWDNSMFLFIAPEGGKIKARTGEEWEEFDVTPSTEVQSIKLPGSTGRFELETEQEGIIGLGVWLDGAKGVSVDCMSTRGNSGLTLKSINSELCRQMSKYVDYRLIILEFGINAMSPGQTNFSVYKKQMINVVNKLKACYPRADILIMGIGDRGEKKEGEIHSTTGTRNMIDAQRDVARQTQSLFWDTREAMGGEDAIVNWSNKGLANKDYVHLSHKGGKQLATMLVESIKTNLNR